METVDQDTDMLWTADLAVGCAALDERNRQMLDDLSRAASVVAASEPAQLADWMMARFDQVEVLFQEEERELAAVDYPELAFHQRLHDRARAIMRHARAQLLRVDTPAALATLARESCAALALWLPRHIVDADRLFFPYVDVRFRVAV